jgi:exodeoxyribonuclease-5
LYLKNESAENHASVKELFGLLLKRLESENYPYEEILLQYGGDNRCPNGDIAELIKIGNYEERYGLHFAQARLSFPDYDDIEISAKIILDTLDSESASLSSEQQRALYEGVYTDYEHIKTKKKRNESVREDPYYNALQIKYSSAITCHKSQGGQWKCVFIDNAFWQDEISLDELKWLYTAITRAVEKVYFVSFNKLFFE